MAEFSAHTPGTFCWSELGTIDRKGAVAFYRGLFGWDVNDQPMGPDDVYSMFQMRGKEIAAAYTMRAEERQRNVPPHWNAYVSVTSADDAVGKAQELGGKALVPSFDVFDVGRMAVLQDPTGAVFCVWQPKRHIGAKILREPGALCWTELATRDTKAAEKFYTRLFGWSAKTGGAGGAAYTEFSVAGTADSGMMQLNPAWGSVPPHWTPYFAVTDCNTSVAKANALGGKAVKPASDIPKVGRFAVLQDPQGAVFAIIKITNP